MIFRVLLSTVLYCLMLLGVLLSMTLINPSSLQYFSGPFHQQLINVKADDNIYSISSQLFNQNPIHRWVFEYAYLTSAKTYDLKNGPYQIEEGFTLGQVIHDISGE